jgi:glycerate kinase
MRLTLAPQSDGGPRFVGVLAGRLGEVRTLRVSGPLTAEVSAEWVLDPAAPRTDGGRGMVEALGTDVWSTTSARLAAAHEMLAGVELIAATDAEHPLLGPMGAATVFGPQKGADPDTVRVLEQRLTGWPTMSPPPSSSSPAKVGSTTSRCAAKW